MKKRPNLTPKWMGNLIYIQPATLEYLRDVVIDDSRARKMIGSVTLVQKLACCIDNAFEQLQTAMGCCSNYEIYSGPARL